VGKVNRTLCSATIWMGKRIASAEMLRGVRLLPHLKSSPAACAGGVRNEAGEHGNEGRIDRGCGREVPAKRPA
jgi:hypothetical protein